MGTPIDFLQQIRLARKRGKRSQRTEPRARHACYNPATRELELLLWDGRRVVFPVDQLEGLEGASDEALSQVRITPAGTGVYWEELDVDLSVPHLVRGVYGTRAFEARRKSAGEP